MAKKSRSTSKKSALSNPTILTAVIGGIVTIIVAFIGVLPSILDYGSKQKEEGAASITTPVVELATAIAQSTEPVATPTEVSTPTLALTDTPIPTAIFQPSINCLDQWQTVNTSPDLDLTSGTVLDCSTFSIPELRISVLSNDLAFGGGNNVFRNVSGIFGIAVPLPPKADLIFHIESKLLYNAEFWAGFSSTPVPGENDMMVFALQPSGNSSTKANGDGVLYTDGFNNPSVYSWEQLSKGSESSAGPPFLYTLKVNLDHGAINATINELPMNLKFVNQPVYLFFGVYKKSKVGSAAIDVKINNWTIVSTNE